MNLDSLFGYKNKLMEDLLTNERIVKLIDEEKDLSNSRELAYSKVYPLEYIPDTVEHGDTYICFDVDVHESANKTFLYPILYIWVFTHRSKLRLPGGGVRIDELCMEISKAINGSKEYGLGELSLGSIRRFAPMTDYQGKVLTFNAKDFNRQYDPKRYVPANRKGLKA